MAGTSSYASLFGEFVDQLTRLGPLSQLDIGCRVIKELMPQRTSTADSPVVDTIDLPSGEENICQICSDLFSGSNVVYETFDSDDRRRDHAKMHHMKMDRKTENSNKFQQVLFNCFPMIYDAASIDEEHSMNSTSHDVIPKNEAVEQFLATTGRGKRKGRANTTIVKEESPKFQERRRSTRHRSNRRHSSNDEVRVKIHVGPRYHPDILKLAHAFVRKHQPKTKYAVLIKCNLCEFMVKPNASPGAKKNRYYPRYTSMHLVEHALGHFDKTLKYCCCACSIGCDSCVDIRGHMVNQHGIALVNFKVKRLTDEKRALKIIRRCFGDGETANDSNERIITPVRRVGKEEIAHRPALVATKRLGSKKRGFQKGWLSPLWKEFFTKHCDNVHERWTTPANGLFCCRVCQKKIPAVNNHGSLIRPNLVYHATRHCASEDLFSRGKGSVQEMVVRHPKEIGEAVLLCFDPAK